MIRVVLGILALALLVALVQANLHRPEPNGLDEGSKKLIALMERANHSIQLFYDGELETLFQTFSEPMKLLLPLQELAALRERIIRELGKEIEVLDESLTPVDAQLRYDRLVRFDQYDGQVQIQITFDANEQMVGFTIQPLNQSR